METPGLIGPAGPLEIFLNFPPKQIRQLRPPR
jgi:hypothetical protein